MPEHEVSRKKVCFLCFGKSKTMRKITDAILDKIRTYYVQGIDINDDRFPSVICTTCIKILSEHERGIYTRSILLFDHSKLSGVRTRSSYVMDNCTCVLCELAAAKPGNLLCTKKHNVTITQSKGRPPLQRVEPLESTYTSNGLSAVKPEPVKLCAFCLSKLGRGLHHTCTRTTRIANIQQLASPKSNVQVASAILRSNMQDNMVTLTNIHGKPTVLKRESSTSTPDSPTIFTAHDLHSIQCNLNMSNNNVYNLAKHIRTATHKRKSIESHLKTNLHALNHRTDDIFTLSTDTEFNMADGQSEVRPFVYCTDISELVSRIQNNRQHVYTHLKVGLDGGGGFLKVCLNMQDLSNNFEPCATKRHCYKDGVAPQEKKDGSVKRLVIIALVPNIPENYDNAKIILDKLKINELPLPYTLATDLKLANIICGLMSHGSTHPRTWCDISKTQLQLGMTGNVRTIGSLKAAYRRWVSAGSNKADAKLYGNVVHLPLIPEDDMTIVMHIIPPPELHLFIGPVTKLYNALVIYGMMLNSGLHCVEYPGKHTMVAVLREKAV